MPKTVFFLLCCLFSFQLLAQQTPQITQKNNSRIETYFYHQTKYDSFRLHIKGKNDTFLQENFYRNGRLQKQVFGKKDSIFEFDIAGFPSKKTFGMSKDSTLFYFEGNLTKKIFYNRNIDKIDSCSIYKQGKIYGQGKRFGENRWKNNGIEYFLQYYYLDSTQYYSMKYREGRKLYASKVFKNASIRFNDTLFCSDSEAYWAIEGDSLGNITNSIFVNSKGKKQQAITGLKSFKDNVLCAYGFLNQKGDTIISPRFDKVLRLNYLFYAVWKGEKCYLLQPDGKMLESFEATDFPIDPYDTKQIFYNPICDIQGHMIPYDGITVLTDSFDIVRTPWFDEEVVEKKLSCVTKSYENILFAFSNNNQYGVIDGTGKVILPPQIATSFQIYEYTETIKQRTSYLKIINDSLFALTSSPGTLTRALIKRNGTKVFQDANFCTYLSDTFCTFTIQSRKQNNTLEWKVGLGTLNNQIILEPKYLSISLHNDSLAVLETPNGYGVYNFKTQKHHIDTFIEFFDPYKENMILYSMKSKHIEKKNFIFKSRKTNLYGVIDRNWHIVVPPQYHSMLDIGYNTSLYVVQNQDKTFQFLDIDNPRIATKYQNLFQYTDPLWDSLNHKIAPLFFAKKNGKWGIVNTKDQILQPFIFDYVTLQGFLIKDNKLFAFSNHSFPREESNAFWQTTDAALQAFSIIDSIYSIYNNIFFDKNGYIAVPPHYIVTENRNSYNIGNNIFYLIQNQSNKRFLVSYFTGAIVAYPFTYEPIDVPLHSKIAIVCNQENVSRRNFDDYMHNIRFGVVALDGRVLAPCNSFWASIADPKKGLYFLKPDTQFVYKNLKHGGLTAIDTNWFLYDFQGKQLDSVSFRYPFSFHYGLGIGMQGNYFGVFDTTGKAVIPPQYQNIFRDKDNHFIYIVENKGLSSFTSLRNPYGKEIVPIGKYHAISPFYGKYALVKDGEKIGLIDTLGKEIVAPTDLINLQTTNLTDSLLLINKSLNQQLKALEASKLPSQQINEISYRLRVKKKQFPLGDETIAAAINQKVGSDVHSQNIIWNILLDLQQDFYFEKNYTPYIDRSAWHSACWLEYDNKTKYKSGSFNLRSIEKNFISIQVEEQYANYIRENKTWKRINFSDILNINGIKRQEINALLMQKIKALKGVDLDCTEGSDFVKQVLDKFLLTKNGIDFYFPQQKPFPETMVQNYMPITCTWDELSPFLKMRF